jgi:two-component system NarL family sensor kinase
MKISNLAGPAGDPASIELKAGLEDVRTSIAAVASDLRDLSHLLRPATLEILGLVRSLQSQCEEFERLRAIETTFQAAVSDGDASPAAATCLYRVLQEALQNIEKHSGSRSAHVTLTRRSDRLEMRVRDEGKGFVSEETKSAGIGLMNMKDRMRILGGELIVNSRPGWGTEIVVVVPALPQVDQVAQVG